MNVRADNFGELWYEVLSTLLAQQTSVSPRGYETREILDAHLELSDPLNNIFGTPERKLGYKFMVAEWLWIWFGLSDLATLAQYNANMSQFSDDGLTLAGAYGPRIAPSWSYARGLLEKDRDTRQAVIPIYRHPQPISKDIPCTLTMQFLARDERLTLIINMRSSDCWLGLPYDFFTFSMHLNVMAAQLGLKMGELHVNLGSSHLYTRDAERIIELLVLPPITIRSPRVSGAPPDYIKNVLINRQASFGLTYPWASYERVLLARTNKLAREELIELAKLEEEKER